MVSTVGAGSFSAAALKLWNSLPAHIRDVGSLCSFSSLLFSLIETIIFHSLSEFHKTDIYLSYPARSHRINDLRAPVW